MASSLSGQTAAASAVRGVITDASGGIVAGARVELRNLGTGFRRATATNSAGAYLIQALPPGRYELTVASEGFSSATVAGIAVAIGQTIAVDVSLKLGQRRETLTVEGAMPMVEHSSNASSRRSF